MKSIKTVDAVGKIICHDITQIIKDETKDVRFKKGHIVQESDIEVLLSLGKYNLYVWDIDEAESMHENEAAEILSDICCTNNMYKTDVKEGKINVHSSIDGLFRVNTELLYKLNCFDDIIISTIHNNYPVKAGDVLLGTRVVPLIIKREKIQNVLDTCKEEQLCDVLTYKIKKCAVVTTGSEVFDGRIKDTFTDVIKEKLKDFGAEVVYHKIVSDDKESIKEAIKNAKDYGVDMILCTGGMSVDPDDLTPTAIKESGAKVVTYGAPVLPGSMFLLAYFEDGTPIVGLPGCVMYSKHTIFDILLPRLMTKDVITKNDIAKLSNAGFCLSCEVCHYPNCQFGKGV